MAAEDLSQVHKKMAFVQFVAELSLIANCKPSDLKLALTLIADLANTETREDSEDEISTLRND